MTRRMTVRELNAELEQLEAAGWGTSYIDVQTVGRSGLVLSAITGVTLDANGRGRCAITTGDRTPFLIVREHRGQDVAIVIGEGILAHTSIYVWDHQHGHHRLISVVEMSRMMGDDASEFYYSMPHVPFHEVSFESV